MKKAKYVKAENNGQSYIGRLGEWAKYWQMEYSAQKCDYLLWEVTKKRYDLNGNRLQNASE